MLHRGYMRRGVSLEVIVEEDDNAEVSLDPVHFEDDLDSVPSSPASSTDPDGKRDRGEDTGSDSSGRLREEREKRRRQKEEEEEEEKRWRQLARRRSLSCETLTILDVGDDEFSRERWEEEARDWGSEAASGIDQIQHSISRREILAGRTEDQYESEPENQEGPHNTLGGVGEHPDEGEGRCAPRVPEGSGVQLCEEETSVDADDEEENDQFVGTYEDAPVSATSSEVDQVRFSPEGNGSSLARSRPPDLWLQEPFTNDQDSWITVGELISGTPEPLDGSPELPNGTATPSTCTPEPRNGSPDSLNRTSGTPSQSPDPSACFSDEGDWSRPKQKEVRFSDKVEFVTEPVNQPPSDTANGKPPKDIDHPPNSEVLQDHLVSVRTGRDLFEGNRGVRGVNSIPPISDRIMAALENPQVLIVERGSCPEEPEEDLYTSLEDPKPPAFNPHNAELHPEELPAPHTVASVRQIFEAQRGVAMHKDHFMHFESRFDHVRSNPSSKILRFDRDRQKPPPPSPLSSTPSKASPLKRGGPSPARSTPAPDRSSTGVHLRKPRVASRFDVRKALRENPRYFHIRVGERAKKDAKSGGVGGAPAKKTSLGRRNTVTYSYLEAKSQNQRGATTSLRWAKETIDRSDAESLSSESSEDSGVSRDFTSSILTSFSATSRKKKSKWTCPDLLAEEYGADPSFKWIDPSVLSKIRSMGTTVIYFGPRHRPQGQTRSSFKDDLAERRAATSKRLTRMVVRDDGCSEQERRRGGTDARARHTNNYDVKESPRIVGVMHKRDAHDSPTPTIGSVKKFPHRDSTLLLHTREVKRKSTGDNSIIYNFTREAKEEFG